jgi:hypothetical protein
MSAGWLAASRSSSVGSDTSTGVTSEVLALLRLGIGDSDPPWLDSVEASMPNVNRARDGVVPGTPDSAIWRFAPIGRI